MIFEEEKYNTEYDIGPKWTPCICDYKHLAHVICEMVDIIDDDLCNDKVIVLKHSDPDGNKQFLKGGLRNNDISYRDDKNVEELLKRKDRNSISSILEKWGIYEPEEDRDKSDYFKLLYLFYMVQYVIFPEEKNILKLISEKNISSDISPISHASKGRYLSFAFDVLCEDYTVCKNLINEDKEIEKCIYAISDYLDEILVEEKLEFGLDFGPDTVPRVISKTREQLMGIKEKYIVDSGDLHGVLEKAADYIYRYVNLAYSTDMIRNIRDICFAFGDIEEDIRKDKKEERYYIDNRKEYLSIIEDPEVKKFFMKGSRNKPPKQIEAFLDNVINNDVDRLKQFGRAIWVKIDRGSLFIYGRELALILRTFCDLGSSSKFSMDVKVSDKKWEHFVSFRKDLTGKYSSISMALFILAYESEYLVLTKSYGSYAMFFKPFCLEKTVLIQEIMKTSFDIKSAYGRISFLIEVFKAIKHNYQELQSS